jgi:hypothetical protein
LFTAETVPDRSILRFACFGVFVMYVGLAMLAQPAAAQQTTGTSKNNGARAVGKKGKRSKSTKQRNPELSEKRGEMGFYG